VQPDEALQGERWLGSPIELYHVSSVWGLHPSSMSVCAGKAGLQRADAGEHLYLMGALPSRLHAPDPTNKQKSVANCLPGNSQPFSAHVLPRPPARLL
jgi:hypothetical protein